MGKTTVCIYHISEIYLYEYYCHPDETYEIDPVDRVSPLMEKAVEEEKRGGLMGAVQCYEKALELNPVSTQIHFRLIECYFHLNNQEMVKHYTEEVYPFCATRAEMAAYYRWLGWYYLEHYEPELSEVLYRYSTCFEKSRTAESEIAYLEAALNRKMPAYSAPELQKRLEAAKIPVTADNVTLALIEKAGEEAQDKGYDRQALDCYLMVYDLTGDAEIGSRIQELQGRDSPKE